MEWLSLFNTVLWLVGGIGLAVAGGMARQVLVGPGPWLIVGGGVGMALVSLIWVFNAISSVFGMDQFSRFGSNMVLIFQAIGFVAAVSWIAAVMGVFLCVVQVRAMLKHREEVAEIEARLQ
jgi:hypothetical protein